MVKTSHWYRGRPNYCICADCQDCKMNDGLNEIRLSVYYDRQFRSLVTRQPNWRLLRLSSERRLYQITVGTNHICMHTMYEYSTDSSQSLIQNSSLQLAWLKDDVRYHYLHWPAGLFNTRSTIKSISNRGGNTFFSFATWTTRNQGDMMI